MVLEHAPLLSHTQEPDVQEPAWHGQPLEQSVDWQELVQISFMHVCPVGQLQVVLEHAPLALHSQEFDVQTLSWHAQPLEQSVDVQGLLQTPFTQGKDFGQVHVVLEHAPPSLHTQEPDIQVPVLHVHPLMQFVVVQEPLQTPLVQLVGGKHLQEVSEHAPLALHAHEPDTQEPDLHTQLLSQSVVLHVGSHHCKGRGSGRSFERFQIYIK